MPCPVCVPTMKLGRLEFPPLLALVVVGAGAGVVFVVLGEGAGVGLVVGAALVVVGGTSLVVVGISLVVVAGAGFLVVVGAATCWTEEGSAAAAAAALGVGPREAEERCLQRLVFWRLRMGPSEGRSRGAGEATLAAMAWWCPTCLIA